MRKCARQVLGVGATIALVFTTACSSRSTDSQEPHRLGCELPHESRLPAPRLESSETPVVLEFDRPSQMPEPAANSSPQSPPRLELAAWADGRIVWRTHDARLLGAHIPPERIAELLAELHADGVFGAGKVDVANYGPDSSFQVIHVRTSDRDLRLSSWHELAEQNPGLVASDHGIGSLDGRDRDAVLAACAPEYQRFRRVWSRIREATRGWIPPSGEPFSGDVPLH